MFTLAGLETIEVVCRMPIMLDLKVEVVKRISSRERAQSWVVDYSAARARAIEWLGDRYLLAKPINASENGSRNPARTVFRPSRALPGERSA